MTFRSLLVLGRNVAWPFLMPLLLELSFGDSGTSWRCKRGTRRRACARVYMSTLLIHGLVICSCSERCGVAGLGWEGGGSPECCWWSKVWPHQWHHSQWGSASALEQNRMPWLSTCGSTSACVRCASVCGPCLYLTMRACAYLVLVRSCCCTAFVSGLVGWDVTLKPACNPADHPFFKYSPSQMCKIRKLR